MGWKFGERRRSEIAAHVDMHVGGKDRVVSTMWGALHHYIERTDKFLYDPWPMLASGSLILTTSSLQFVAGRRHREGELRKNIGLKSALSIYQAANDKGADQSKVYLTSDDSFRFDAFTDATTVAKFIEESCRTLRLR